MGRLAGFSRLVPLRRLKAGTPTGGRLAALHSMARMITMSRDGVAGHAGAQAAQSP